MADFYSVLGSLGMMPPHEACPMARKNALHAISLDPDLPDGHLALASVLQFYDWQWQEGRKEIERAIDLHPERGESYLPYVWHLMTQGLLEEALVQTLKGLKHDPLSTALLTGQALLRTYLGDHDTSILLAREALKAAPHHELYYTLDSRTRRAADLRMRSRLYSRASKRAECLTSWDGWPMRRSRVAITRRRARR